MLNYNDIPKVNSKRWLLQEDLPGEVWKDVPGYESILRVSNYSRVMNLANKRIIRQSVTRDKYYIIGIKINDKSKCLYPHRLVALAFLPNPENKLCIDHIDANRANNILSNLKWATHKENANNAITKKNRKISHEHTVFSDKRIAKLDRCGNMIYVYNSVTEAAFKNGLAKCSISNAAHNRIMRNQNGNYYQCNTAGGFKWKFL